MVKIPKWLMQYFCDITPIKTQSKFQSHFGCFYFLNVQGESKVSYIMSKHFCTRPTLYFHPASMSLEL